MPTPLNYTQTGGATYDKTNPTTDDLLNIARLAFNSSGENFTYVPNTAYNPQLPNSDSNSPYSKQVMDLGSNANTWMQYAAQYLKSGTTGYSPYDQFFASAIDQHFNQKTTAPPPATPTNQTVQGDTITPTPTTQELQGLTPLANQTAPGSSAPSTTTAAVATPSAPSAPGVQSSAGDTSIIGTPPIAPTAGASPNSTAPSPTAVSSSTNSAVSAPAVTKDTVFDYLKSNPNPLIGTRQIPGQQQLEYFNTQTNEGFHNPQELADFINQNQGSANPTAAGPLGNIQPEVDALLKEWGLTPPSPSTAPIISFSDSYKKVFTDLGLPDLATQIQSVIKSYGDLNTELQGKISDVNENPWLTEDVRQRQIKQLQDRYDLKLTALSSQQTLMQTMYDKGVSQAQFVATQTASAASAQQTLDANLITKAMDIASRQAIAQINLTKSFKLSAGQTDYAYNPDTGQFEPIASVAPKPQIVSGSKYGKYEVASDGTLIPVGGGGGGGGGGGSSLTEAINAADEFIQNGNDQLPGVGSDGYVSPETYNAARAAWTQDGHPVSTFDTKFSKYINPADPQDYKGAKIPKPTKGSQGVPVGFASGAA